MEELDKLLKPEAIVQRSKEAFMIAEFRALNIKYIALKQSHKDLTDTLEFLLTDIQWNNNSPSLKLVKRMIKQAKKLQK